MAIDSKEIQIGWEHLTHQGLVLQVDNHSLVEVANMFHEIHPSIIHGKRWLGEPSRSLSASLLWVKGDLEIWLKAPLMASLPRPL